MTGADQPDIVVLDASALLALLLRETGAEAVRGLLLGGGWISAVNWSETRQKLAQRGVRPATTDHLPLLGLRVEPFGVADAEACADMFALTRGAGLSLGDRACLALAARLGGVAVTADTAWKSVDVGVRVLLVR